jgi:hypothetical protein
MVASSNQLQRAIAALTDDDRETVRAWLAPEDRSDNDALREFVRRRVHELDTGVVDWHDEPLRNFSPRDYDALVRFVLGGRSMPWSETNREWCRAVLAAMQDARNPRQATAPPRRRRNPLLGDGRFTSQAAITEYILAAYREQRLGRPGSRLPAAAPLAREADALIRQAIRLAGHGGITGVELRSLIPFGAKRVALGLQHLEASGQITQTKEVRPNSRGVPHEQLVWQAVGLPEPEPEPPERTVPVRCGVSSTAPFGAT